MRLLLIFFAILLSGCADRHVRYSGLSEVEASGVYAGTSLDSIVQKYKESLSTLEKLTQNTEIKFTTVEYSKPDSLGNQHKVKETTGTINQESKQEKETESNITDDYYSVSKKDSTSETSMSERTEESFSEDKEVSGLNRLIAPLAMIIIIGGIIYLLKSNLKIFKK